MKEQDFLACICFCKLCLPSIISWYECLGTWAVQTWWKSDLQFWHPGWHSYAWWQLPWVQRVSKTFDQNPCKVKRDIQRLLTKCEFSYSSQCQQLGLSGPEFSSLSPFWGQIINWSEFEGWYILQNVNKNAKPNPTVKSQHVFKDISI